MAQHTASLLASASVLVLVAKMPPIDPSLIVQSLEPKKVTIHSDLDWGFGFAASVAVMRSASHRAERGMAQRIQNKLR